MFYIGLFLLFIAVLWLFALWQREYRGAILLTPLLLFVSQDILFVWPSAIASYWTGQFQDGYPVIVVALGMLAFLFGFTIFSKYQRLALYFAE
ncbi:MAG: hypothetical protein H0T73_00790, partial [Ardenticatenales bacterium]|nr:hypothetical protein [Ardenticatenales bacterium]